MVSSRRTVSQNDVNNDCYLSKHRYNTVRDYSEIGIVTQGAPAEFKTQEHGQEFDLPKLETLSCSDELSNDGDVNAYSS